MPDLDPFNSLRRLQDVPPETLYVLLLAMLDRHSELQERLGLMTMDQRLGDGLQLKTRADELSVPQHDQLEEVIDETLNAIGSLEREIERRLAGTHSS